MRVKETKEKKKQSRLALLCDRLRHRTCQLKSSDVQFFFLLGSLSYLSTSFHSPTLSPPHPHLLLSFTPTLLLRRHQLDYFQLQPTAPCRQHHHQHYETLTSKRQQPPSGLGNKQHVVDFHLVLSHSSPTRKKPFCPSHSPSHQNLLLI